MVSASRIEKLWGQGVYTGSAKIMPEGPTLLPGAGQLCPRADMGSCSQPRGGQGTAGDFLTPMPMCRTEQQGHCPGDGWHSRQAADKERPESSGSRYCRQGLRV